MRILETKSTELEKPHKQSNAIEGRRENRLHLNFVILSVCNSPS